MNAKKLKLTMWMAGVALLAGCGGGDGGGEVVVTPPPAPPDPLAAVPDSARQSIEGLAIYLKTLTLPLNLSDSREPIALDGVTLPTSDTAEPAAI